MDFPLRLTAHLVSAARVSAWICVAADRPDNARSAVADHKQRVAEPAPAHVLEEGPNRLGVLLRSRHEVQQDLAPFLADAPGRQNRLACLACPKPLGASTKR